MSIALEQAPADGGYAAGAPTASRLRRELLALELRRPRAARALRRVWQRPAAGLVPLALVVGTICGILRQDGDEVRFRAAGATMLGPHAFDVLSDSWLQIGPVYLFFVGCIERACTALGLPPLAVSVVAAQAHAVVVALLATVVAGAAARLADVRVREVQWIVGGCLIVGGFLHNSLEADHPEELILGLVVAYAAVLLAARRPRGAVLLLVLGAGIKQWVPTSAGLLLHERRPRTVALRIAACVAGVLLVYAPFAVLGHVSTFAHSWPFPQHYWLARLPVVGRLSDWGQRMVQGGVAGVAGALVAARRRGSLLVSPLASIATRLALDPLRLTYYWAALAPVLYLWLWTSTVPVVRRLRVPLTFGLALVTLCSLVPRGPWWHAETVVALGLPVFALMAERTPRASRSRSAEAVPSPARV